MKWILTLIQNYLLLTGLALSLVISVTVTAFVNFARNALSLSSEFPYVSVIDTTKMNDTTTWLVFCFTLIVCILLVFMDNLRKNHADHSRLRRIQENISGNWIGTYDLKYQFNEEKKTITHNVSVRMDIEELPRMRITWDLRGNDMFDNDKFEVDTAIIARLPNRDGYYLTYYTKQNMNPKNGNENIEVEIFFIASFEERNNEVQEITAKWHDLNGHLAKLMISNAIEIDAAQPYHGEIKLNRLIS